MKTRNAALGLAALLAVGCAGSKPVPVAEPACTTGPDWTCTRSGPCTLPELKGQLCSVGIAENITSYALGMDAAATRARVEMGAVVKTKVDGFTRTVQDSAFKMGTGEDSIQKIGSMSQTVVDETLHAVAVPKTFYNEKTRTYFALASLDAKTFVDALKGLKQAGSLSDQVKKEIDARAETVVQEWGQERDRAK